MNRLVGRRSFVLGALVAGGALVLRRLAPWRALVEVDRAARSRLARLFSRPDSAATVGRWYLAAAPHEDSVAALTAAVTAVLPSGAVRGHDDPLRQAVARQVNLEFAAGDVVYLDGWIVSRTEARLCALAALDNDRGSRSASAGNTLP